jgi:hypothetical protein
MWRRRLRPAVEGEMGPDKARWTKPQPDVALWGLNRADSADGHVCKGLGDTGAKIAGIRPI